MNIYNQLTWKKITNTENGKEYLISDIAVAENNLKIIPKSERIEYTVEYLNRKNRVEYERVYTGEGCIIYKDSIYSIKIRFIDCDKAPEAYEVLQLGFTIMPYEAKDSIDVWDTPFGSFTLTPYLNGLKIAKTLKENMKRISPDGEYGHQTTTIIKNGVAYTVFTANNITLKEYDCNTFSNLAVYDVSNPENARFFTVAKQGVNGNITIDGVSSLVSMVEYGNDLVCHCYGFIDGVITEFRRVFDTEKECFGELEICKITKDGTAYDFTNENVLKLLGAEYGLVKIGVEFGFGNYFKCNDEWYCWLITGTPNFCGVLLKTKDLMNFEFVMVPDKCRGTNCEIVSYLFKDYLYVAYRHIYQAQRLEVVKYDMRSLRAVESIVLKDTAMRPYFYEYNNELYLVHATHTRSNTSIIKLSTEKFLLASKCVAEIENLDLNTPCPVIYNNELYITFTSNKTGYSQIYISHFSPDMPYSDEQVNNAVLKLLEKELS